MVSNNSSEKYLLTDERTSIKNTAKSLLLYNYFEIYLLTL